MLQMAKIKLPAICVLVSVFLAILTYYLWLPLPEHMDQKGIVRIVYVLDQMSLWLRWVGPAFLGHKHPFIFTRAVVGLHGSMTPLEYDPDLKVTDDFFDGVPVRVYRPKMATNPSPALIFIHGGGWVLGSVDTEDRNARYMAKNANVVTVSVEYRLAPEHPFPAALDDCVSATVHVLTKGHALNIDVNNVGLTGFSAGGNLAAAIVLRLQALQFKAIPTVKYQLLVAPVLQSVDFTLPSYTDNDQGIIVTRSHVVEMSLAYSGLEITYNNTQQIMSDGEKKNPLSDVPNTDEIIPVNENLVSVAEPIYLNPLFSPLLATDDAIKRLPPSFLVAAQYDVMRDDAILYFKRLRQLGVKASLYNILTGHHATSLLLFKDQPQTKVAEDALQQLVHFIRENVAENE